MPERLAYDEAVLFSSVRLKIQDPELRQGKVELALINTSSGTIQHPWAMEGGFAVVYKFRTKSGRLRALRCFRVPMNPDTQFRYERIGAYFAAHIPNNTASFKYHDQGILVKESGQPQGGRVYPVIEMDWIEGMNLLEKVDELTEKRDRAELYNLVNQWTGLLVAMRRNHIAQGDLSGRDIIVRTDGQLILIDYDGVYIPEFAGLAQVVLGQIDYQHPQMAQREFNEFMDDFSALVIYTALLALARQPELWNKYTRKNKQGRLLDTNLMFVEQDFRDPNQSALMQELQSINDTQLQLAVQELKKACRQPVNQVRFPFHILDSNHGNMDINYSMKEKKVEIFFCYARKDQMFLDDLKMHLMPLERQGFIKVWHDADISPGAEWEDEIRKHLNTADIILLLISPNFMASEYCYSKEMTRAMERHEHGEAHVIPIILRSIYWHNAPFGKLQALPRDALPITRWQDRDDALFDVAEGVRTVVERLILSA